MDTVQFLHRVRDWLVAHNKDRKWLGEQVGVSKRTVDNWFTQKSMPLGKRELIEKVIKPNPGLRASVKCTVSFSVAEWLAICEALPPGADVENIVRQYLLGYAVQKADNFIELHDPRTDDGGGWEAAEPEE
jgi:hypothetical protein